MRKKWTNNLNAGKEEGTIDLSLQKSNDDNEEKREQQHFPGTVLPFLFRGGDEKFKVNLPVRL